VTDQPDANRRVPTGPPAEGAHEPPAEKVVVRDKRRVRPASARAEPGAETGPPQPDAAAPATDAPPSTAEPSTAGPAEVGPAEVGPAEVGPAEVGPAEVGPAEVGPAEVGPAEVGPAGFAAELEAVRAELEERTRDLQRVSAEYANYRKRVDRDRALIGEQAAATVLSALLPVLDDLDRAREHGELAEGVAAVVDQLLATTAKFGLSAFGEKGDPFDPNRHEAVAHQTSIEVSQPTCVDILRRGYLLGDRLLRPAMVAVADPG
jgi:molecular chaperone GrpE